jgi:FkbH-like protein
MAMIGDPPTSSLGELRRRFRSSPKLSTARQVIDALAAAPGAQDRPVVRLAILRSFTIEPVVPFLRAGAALEGIDARISVLDFNTYAQDILDPGSALYSGHPDVVLLAVQTRDLLPRVWSAWTDEPAAARQDVDDAVSSLTALVTTLRERTSALLILQGLERPAWPSAGILDAQAPGGQVDAIDSINAALRGLAARIAAVHFLDYDALVARHGRGRWHDEAKFLVARMPIAADALPLLAEEYLRFLLPVAGRLRKVLVLDLDNTLWGGIVGEVGPDGVQLGDEYPGAGYRALQRAALDLHARGVLLAINSRNNLEDAMGVIEDHPGMLLRPSHFSAIRINWRDKAANLREIALELNVGLDSLAFLDDNPAERERVEQALPEVLVIPLPTDPLGYARALRDVPGFERLSLSAEDRDRGRLYAAERLRTGLRSDAGSLEDFYRSLDMRVTIAPVNPRTLGRIAQLTQKTNQFNVTTRRYNEQEVTVLASRGRVLGLRSEDRFGDNGLVGVAILTFTGDSAEIDSLLLSCRVIGRTIETALLARLADEARASGARTLRGRFIPTKKNAPARDLYRAHGFTLGETQGEGECWVFDLAQAGPATPEWIEVLAE